MAELPKPFRLGPPQRVDRDSPPGSDRPPDRILRKSPPEVVRKGRRKKKDEDDIALALDIETFVKSQGWDPNMIRKIIELEQDWPTNGSFTEIVERYRELLEHEEFIEDNIHIKWAAWKIRDAFLIAFEDHPEDPRIMGTYKKPFNIEEIRDNIIVLFDSTMKFAASDPANYLKYFFTITAAMKLRGEEELLPYWIHLFMNAMADPQNEDELEIQRYLHDFVRDIDTYAEMSPLKDNFTPRMFVPLPQNVAKKYFTNIIPHREPRTPPYYHGTSPLTLTPQKGDEISDDEWTMKPIRLSDQNLLENPFTSSEDEDEDVFLPSPLDLSRETSRDSIEEKRERYASKMKEFLSLGAISSVFYFFLVDVLIDEKVFSNWVKWAIEMADMELLDLLFKYDLGGLSASMVAINTLDLVPGWPEPKYSPSSFDRIRSSNTQVDEVVDFNPFVYVAMIASPDVLSKEKVEKIVEFFLRQFRAQSSWYTGPKKLWWNPTFASNLAIKTIIHVDYFEVFKLLMESQDVKDYEKDNQDLLEFTTRNGFDKYTRYLLVEGSDVTISDNNDNSALMNVVMFGNVETLIFFLKDVNVLQTMDQDRIIMAAIKRGDFEIVESIFEELGVFEESTREIKKEWLDFVEDKRKMRNLPRTLRGSGDWEEIWTFLNKKKKGEEEE